MRHGRRLASLLVLGLSGCGGSGESPQPPPTTAGAAVSAYDRLILADGPILYLTMGTPEQGRELDRTGRPRQGTYAPAGSPPQATALPNGDLCARFDGASQYLEVPDADDLSIPTTRRLTLEAWMRPDVLELPSKEGTGYVHWLGKGESGAQEYVLRMYSLTNTESRPSRISGYAFNLSGGLGSGSYFQDPLSAGEWIHVVVAFDLDEMPGAIPGTVKIYKNGVLRDTDALAAFQVVPGNGTAPLRVGTRDRHSFFPGAIGKVAVYDRQLTPAQVLSHAQAMATAR
jgi:hypothetical protein